MDPPSPILLLEERECLQLFRLLRWRNGVRCPLCRSRRVKRNGHYGIYQRYLCKACGRSFNDKTGTIFHYSHTRLGVWFLVIHLAFILEKSIRATAKEACLPYRVCYRMVRSVMGRLYYRTVQVRLRGVVEVDEFYLNAGLKGRAYKSKLGRPPRCRGLRPPPGRGSYWKDTPLTLCLQQRDGPLVLRPLMDQSPVGVIRSLVESGSTIYTDDWAAYEGLASYGYNHETVNHSLGEYVRGEVHVNHDEGVVSLFKPWLGKHRGVNKRNLPVYEAAFQTVYNMRELSNRGKFWKIMKICVSNNISH